MPRTPTEAACTPGPLDHLLDHRLFSALGDPTRARILACIAKCDRPCAVGEIAACCSVDLSVVSRHLRILALAGALESSRDGRIVRYAVRTDALAATFRTLADLLEHPAACSSSRRARPSERGGRRGCC